MLTEYVYLGRDNSIDLILKADDVVVNLSSVTAMEIVIGDVVISSDNGDADPIRWAKAGYDTGEVRLYLGGEETIIAGDYTGTSNRASLIVIDAGNPNGIHWSDIPMKVIAIDE
jgi:hypothetical protein